MTPLRAALEFASLLVIVNPVALAPAFAELTRGMPPARARRTAGVGVGVGFALIGLSGVAGHLALRLLGAELALAHLVAAAALLVMGAAMLLGRAGFGSLAGAGRRDPGLVPLAAPLIAGPGAIAAMAAFAGRSAGHPGSLLLLYGLLAAVAALTYAALRRADAIAARLGERGVRLVTRALGLALVGAGARLLYEALRDYGAPAV